MKPVKGYRYVEWPCQRLAAKLLLPKTALNGPVPCVPSPLAQACGGEDILYTFSQYFLDTLSSGPHYKSLLGALLLAAPCFSNVQESPIFLLFILKFRMHSYTLILVICGFHTCKYNSHYFTWSVQVKSWGTFVVTHGHSACAKWQKHVSHSALFLAKKTDFSYSLQLALLPSILQH